MKRNLCTLIFFVTACITVKAQSWLINGNSNINGTTSFLGTTNSKPVIFKTNGLERMRISKTGRVGIGTSTPQAQFNVTAGGSVSLTSTDSVLLGSLTGLNIAFDNHEIQARNNNAGSTLFLNYWGGDTWIGNHSGAATPAVYTSAAGQTGIGSNTTQAGYALTVNPFSSGSAIYINDPGDGYFALGTKSGNNGEGFRMNISSTSNPFSAIRGHTDGTGFGVLAESTNTGMGVQGYSTKSYGVWGQTGNSSSYAGYFEGNVFTTGTYNSSDENLKQNIKDFPDAMSIINQLHPKQYQYRQDGNYRLMNLPQGDHFGLIAQDVEKVLPGLVKDTKFYTSKSDPTRSDELKNAPDIDFKALNYTELIPVIIKAMQEQQATIQNLQSENEQIKQQINELKQMIVANNASAATAGTNANGAYLLQNAPNPFNQNTTIQCYVPSSVKQARLAVYSMKGQLIRSFSLNNGMNNVSIDANTLSSGQYSYTVLADGKKSDSKSMTIAK
jgi:hypothetical protein